MNIVTLQRDIKDMEMQLVNGDESRFLKVGSFDAQVLLRVSSTRTGQCRNLIEGRSRDMAREELRKVLSFVVAMRSWCAW